MKLDDNSVVTEEVGRYTLSYYPSGTDKIVVVFASAGARLAGPIEEFKGSLREYGVSMLFVRDRDASWYQEPEVISMFEKVADLVRPYKHIAVMGESMGGSGVMIFPRFCQNISRSLAFSPIYSYGPPYNQFAAGWDNDRIPHLWVFDSDDEKARENSVLLYGSRQWQDAPHAGVYALEGYPVLMIKGAGHLVAAYLKKGNKINYLKKILDAFLDFSRPFNVGEVKKILANVVARYGLEEREWNFEAVMRRSHIRVGDAQRLPPPPGCVDLALHRPTDQSSVWEQAAGKTTQEDSARAVAETIPEFYAFHTNLEDNAWWKVDLGDGAEVEELRIYNRIDDASERGLRFSIQIYENRQWKTVFKKDNYDMFGGIDGTPFVWRPEKKLKTRYLRIRSLALEGYLHYQKIEIFGRRQKKSLLKKDINSSYF